MSTQNNLLQRPPAAVLYADELAKLKQNDNAPCPPGWQLSLPAARAFILGDETKNISRKVVISPSAIERMLVTLATGRGLMLVGEPGTAKSLLSELLATAIMSTAEAVNVAHAVGVRAWFLANRAGEPADLVDCIAGTIVKDNEEDRARLRRYFEQRVATHKEAHWQAYYQARHRLP
ncbi:hypothetical protein Q0Q97_19260 [Escherichia marmotae]|uniref:hypothetical protein n=1 Tax=Escherichia marmotae TaxID=1499973 RepID=UPI002F2D0373